MTIRQEFINQEEIFIEPLRKLIMLLLQLGVIDRINVTVKETGVRGQMWMER